MTAGSCLKKISLLFFTVFFSLLFLEAGLRVFDLMRGRSVKARTYWYWLFEQDPYIGYRGRANVVIETPIEVVMHNADGFRDKRTFAQLEKMESKKLVICVGESSTYGLSAGREEATYPFFLEKELRRLTNDDSWIVFNAGMPGYSSYEILSLTRLRLLKLKPSIVLDMNLRNDHEFVCRYLDGEQDYDFYPLRLANFSKSSINEILMRSSLYGFFATRILVPSVRDDLGGKQPRKHSKVTDQGLRFYTENLRLLSVACSSSHARLMCVDQPINYKDRRYSEPDINELEIMRKGLRQVCKTEDIPLLRAHSDFKWDNLAPTDDVHLSAAGYQALAEMLAPQIIAFQKK